jgi:hypothetical protein
MIGAPGGRGRWACRRRGLSATVLFSIAALAGSGSGCEKSRIDGGVDMADADRDTLREVIRNEDGRTSRIRFFATWGGYRNPVKPQDRIDLTAAQNLPVYYECAFEDSGKREVLVRFEKYELEKRELRDIEIPADLAAARFIGFEGWSGDTPVGLHTLRPADVLASSEYLFVPDGAKKGEALHVRRSRISSREYRYGENGKYVDFIDHAP